MFLRELFEAKAKKVVAVMPGGFHPFHPGHKSLYDWAVETFGKDNVYVAATNDTKSRPFPFQIKQKLAAMAGVPANRFIEVKSPFNALSYDRIIGDPANTSLVFIRSEKDKSSHPKPDQIRKSDGNMGYLISWPGQAEQTADTHGYMAYGPTINFTFGNMAIKSASELRGNWPNMSDEDKLTAADLMYPGNGKVAAGMLDDALGSNPDVEEDIDEAHGNSSKYDKCWPGYRKVRGKKRGEKGSCVKESNVDQSLPQIIKPLKVPAFPEMPQQDGELGGGQQAGPTKDGGKYLSGSQGKFIWDAQGKPSKWHAPSLGSTSQIYNIKTGDITVRLQNGESDVSAVYDKTGKLKPGQSSASYDMGIAKVSTGPQGNTVTTRGGTPAQDQTVAVR